MIGSEISILILNENQKGLQETLRMFDQDFCAQICMLSDRSKLPEYLAQNKIHLLVLDLDLDQKKETEYFSDFLSLAGHIPVIVTTHSTQFQDMMDTMRMGAFDVLSYPLEHHLLQNTVMRALELHDLQLEVAHLRSYSNRKQQAQNPQMPSFFDSQDPGMKSIFHYAEAMALTNDCLLLIGESGVGKLRMAKSIHLLSGRSGACEWVKLDNKKEHSLLKKLDEQLNKSEIDSGSHTCVISDLENLSKAGQKKLYGILKKHDKISDFGVVSRLILCANVDLHAKMEQGEFLSELYLRLVTHQLHIPSLRQRSKDYKMLVDQFVHKAATHYQKNCPIVPMQVTELIASYDFPGNVRELKNLIFAWVEENSSRSLGIPKLKKLLKKFQEQDRFNRPAQVTLHTLNLNDAKHILVKEAMHIAGHNQSVAAEILGFSRQSLSSYLNSLKSKTK